MISVAINITWEGGGGGGGGEGGEGGLKNCNDSTSKLMATGYRHPEHNCTLQVLFSYLSQKILARIVARPSHGLPNLLR